jgi:hypothetical protein
MRQPFLDISVVYLTGGVPSALRPREWILRIQLHIISSEVSLSVYRLGGLT